MHARPVVGGLFIKMLTDAAIWKKWAKAGDSPVGPYAPLPDLPTLTAILPPKLNGSLDWRYTLVQPAADWNTPGFNDSAWQQGKANSWIPTQYDPKKSQPKITQVWMRTQVTLPNPIPPNFQWILSGHGNGEIYTNGVRAGTISDHGNAEPLPFYPPAKAFIQPGATLTIAAHVQDRDKPLAKVLLGTSSSP